MKHPVYSGLKYSFIFLDGPHTTKDVLLKLYGLLINQQKYSNDI